MASNFSYSTKTGLLNDPNGLVYHNGVYHIFHQWFPLGAVHGLKYWYHYTSKDLLEYKDEGIALAPDTEYDSHGVYSGSAFDYDGKLYLMYTGNVRNENWDRKSVQMIAEQLEDGTFKSLINQLFQTSQKDILNILETLKYGLRTESTMQYLGFKERMKQVRLLYMNLKIFKIGTLKGD